MGAVLPSSVRAGPPYHVELIEGREVEKPVPKKLHILIQSYLIVALSRLLPSRFVTLPECNTLTGGKTADGRREYIVPNVVVVPRSARFEDGDLAEAPVLGVEILSPGQTIAELFGRADRLVKLGCRNVWVIWPEKRRAWAVGLDMLDEAGSTMVLRMAEGGEEAEHVIIQLSEMWAELERSS